MVDISAVTLKLIDLALDLRAIITQILDVRKSKERFVNALSEEVDILESLRNRIIEFDKKVTELLDGIGMYPTLDELDEIMNLSAESMLIFSEMIHAYIRYSIAVKELSVNEYLMDTLKKRKGMLYDYVMRVSETVVGDNRIIIGGNFYRFLKAHKKDIFPKMNKKEAKELDEKINRYYGIIKTKIFPAFLEQKPRILFRPKRIKRIYREPMKQLIKDKNKIQINIPEENLIKLEIFQSSPILMVYEEIVALEEKLKKQKRLLNRSRR